MTQQELFKRHISMCEYCNSKNCDGIHLTINNTTVCEFGEMKEPIAHEIITPGLIENDMGGLQKSEKV